MDNSEQRSSEGPDAERGAPEGGAESQEKGESVEAERKWGLEELQQRMAEEIARFYDGDEGERVRNLCSMAVQWNVDPETYRGLLVQFGLRPPRASEIKAVLMCETECRKFVRGGPWKEALRRSRLQGEKDLRRNAVRLLRLMARYPACLAAEKCGDWGIEHDELGQTRFTHPENGTLEQFKADTDEQGLYVRLVDIGRRRAKKISLKAYGEVLAAEGFSPPRVSEVRRILIDEPTAGKFVAGNLTVTVALNMAREAYRLGRGKQPPPPHPAVKKNPAEALIARTLDGLALVFQRRGAVGASARGNLLEDPSPEQIGVHLFRYRKGTADLTVKRRKLMVSEDGGVNDKN